MRPHTWQDLKSHSYDGIVSLGKMLLEGRECPERSRLTCDILHFCPKPFLTPRRLVPEGRGHYWALWTLVFSCLVFTFFFFMAGQLQAWTLSQAVQGSPEW